MLLREVVGQKHAVALLARAAGHGRAADTYLFHGPEGVGKRITAVAFALALACPVDPGHGCGSCDTCLRMTAGHHPDLRQFDAEDLGAQARAAGFEARGVDFLKERILPLALERPHEARARVLILDHADHFTPHMQNAMLKTLEEPAPRVHLVLLTSAPDRLLATVRSRAQRVRFTQLGGVDLINLVMHTGVDRGRAETAAALADGSAARAMAALAHHTDEAHWQAVATFRTAAAAQEASAIFDAAAGFGGKDQRDDLYELLGLLGRFYRDALADAVGAPELALLQVQQPAWQAVAHAARHSHGLASLRKVLSAVVETEDALQANVNATTALERLLFALRPLEGARAAGVVV